MKRKDTKVGVPLACLKHVQMETISYLMKSLSAFCLIQIYRISLCLPCRFVHVYTFRWSANSADANFLLWQFVTFWSLHILSSTRFIE